MSQEEKLMKRALELAKKGEGKVNPNPLVGALVVKDGKIIGQGYHQEYGGPHAEVSALCDAGDETKGADLYVTLEPCTHHGKTPPCVNKVIESQVKKVFIGSRDPFPEVNGKGIDTLREAGIAVEEGIREEEAKKFNEIYFKYITTGKPFVMLKMAMTLDGKIATRTGDSKWISNEESRKFVHSLRNKYSSVLIGINTVLKDDPRLNVRLVDGVDPLRIVLDSEGKIPLKAKIITEKSEAKTIIATTKIPKEKEKALAEFNVLVWKLDEKNGRVNLSSLLERLSREKIDSVIVEGGGTVAWSFLESGLLDKVIFFVAPKIVGGKRALTPVEGEGVKKIIDAFEITTYSVEMLGNDLVYEGYLSSKDRPSSYFS